MGMMSSEPEETRSRKLVVYMVFLAPWNVGLLLVWSALLWLCLPVRSGDAGYVPTRFAMAITTLAVLGAVTLQIWAVRRQIGPPRRANGDAFCCEGCGYPLPPVATPGRDWERCPECGRVTPRLVE